MERETLLKLYDRVTALVQKLPGGLQKPILNELVPIRRVFLESRPARVMVLGPGGGPLASALDALAGGPGTVAGPCDNGWRRYDFARRGSLEVLDARGDLDRSFAVQGLQRFEPDVLLWLQGEESVPASHVEEAAARAALCPRDVPVVGWAPAGEAPVARAAAALASARELAMRKPEVFATTDREDFAEHVCGILPDAAKLEFARATGARHAQAQIARSLLKSFTAVCGIIGVQPIPLADLPVLTGLQTLMVALIIQTTGRRMTPRLVTEFLGALGFNIGAGFLFREGARAVIKIFPFWGNAVSGLVAGAGTYAIGRAAIAYFIEEAPAAEARKLFEKLRPGRKTFAKPPPLPE